MRLIPNGGTGGGGGGSPTGPAGGDLAATYPNPNVAAVHETGGPTQLTIGAIADGQVVTRSGTALIGVNASGAPTGPAGGDLGGTYPNPVVDAVHTGATQLTIGTINDGEVLVRSGTTIVSSPEAFPPSGAAGGDLSGTYPSPTVAKIQGVAVDTTAPTANQVLEYNSGTSKWTPTALPAALPPNGSATGDLGGTYPAPTVAAIHETSGPTQLVIGAIANSQMLVRSGATLIGQAVPAALPPSGAAAGDLSGTYPNPVVAKIQGIGIDTAVPTNGQVLEYNSGTTKWTPAALPAALPPNGSATGDLGGTYPAPTVAAIHETSGPTKLTIGSVADTQMLVRSGTNLIGTAVPTALPPNGSASGDLGGTYPSPTVAAIHETSGPTKLTIGAVADTQMLVRSGTTLVGAAVPTALPPNGAAGGDLSGTYPNPTVAKIQGVSIDTTAPTNGQVLEYNSGTTKWAPTNLPAALPPNGAASGDLSGTYPGPTVAKIQGTAVSSSAPTTGQLMQYNGTNWVPVTRNVNTSAPLTGGGSLAADLTLGLTGNLRQNAVTVTNAASPYTPLTTDMLICADVSAGALTINLPTAASMTGFFNLWDFKNNANVNNITLVPNGTDKINGLNANLVLTSQGGRWMLMSGGATPGWFVGGM